MEEGVRGTQSSSHVELIVCAVLRSCRCEYTDHCPTVEISGRFGNIGKVSLFVSGT